MTPHARSTRPAPTTHQNKYGVNVKAPTPSTQTGACWEGGMSCKRCSESFLCGDGRTTVYGSTVRECSRFHTAARAFDTMIRRWTVVDNSTAAELYPGCRQALETFFCSQEEVYRDDGVEPSACSAYRRPDHTNVHRCLAFCPAIRDTCPAAAYAYCQERCRSLHVPDYCNVIEVVGLEHSRYPPDTVDIMNLYRIEQEADTALLRNGRPYYRSIPARRYGGQYGAVGGGSTTKQEYFLYSTQIRGFPEWLLDTNDEDSDGAVAFVSDANMEPSKINSDCKLPATRALHPYRPS